MSKFNIDDKEWIRQLKGEQDSNNEAQATTNAEYPKMEKSLKTTKPGLKDIAGMYNLKQLIQESFINVLNNRECANAFKVVPPNILLYGPPGTGKSYVASAIGNDLGINFIKVTPDVIACKWMHGTVEKIARLFNEAEEKGPSLMFLDEIDCMIPKRTSDDRSNQNDEVDEFLNMLSTASERNIFVLAATNHPNLLDPAALRTGRFDEMYFISLPDLAERQEFFQMSLSELPASNDIDHKKLADITKGFNFSDLSYIVKIASRRAFNASILERDKPYKLITQSELEDVISQRTPSVSEKDLREYERVRSIYSPKDEGLRMQRIGFR